MSEWKELKRVRFKLPCFLFEMQKPHFIWGNIILGTWAYYLHDLLCPEMWLFRLKAPDIAKRIRMIE